MSHEAMMEVASQMALVLFKHQPTVQEAMCISAMATTCRVVAKDNETLLIHKEHAVKQLSDAFDHLINLNPASN